VLVWVEGSNTIPNINQKRKIMETRKSLLFSVGVLAFAALLVTTNIFAAPPTQCTTKDFKVSVQWQTNNGVTTYIYTLGNNGASTVKANKFFVYVKGRQVDGQGLQGDLQGTIAGVPSGGYVNNGDPSPAINCPPRSAWKTDKNDDGWCFNSVVMTDKPTLTVSERFNPEEGQTTVLLYKNSGFQSCGPILGPTTPAAPKFESSPVANITSRLCFTNGCCYDVTSGARDNIIISMVPRPETPVETVCGISGCQACTVTNTPDICETDLQIPFCPPLELGRPPLQGALGGTCYAPPNLKFRC
jgi:hypothetical protein